MAASSIRNVLVQAANPARFRVMARKILRRISDTRGGRSATENQQWLAENAVDFAEFAQSINPSLWQESQRAAAELSADAERQLRSIEFDLGGGGIYPLLFFITRLISPQIIVETGVAAGFSSYSFLAALDKNGRGSLYSSDFPYFRLPNPEQYIGVIVPERLRDGWQLYIDGDEINLPRIIKAVDRVDIFHYDSDKSYSGRSDAMALIQPKLHARSIVLMDDIQDNAFFFDHVEANRPSAWRIFEFEGKYVGMLGDLVDRLAA